MTGHSWADEVMLGHCPCPQPLHRRFIQCLWRLLQKSFKLCMLILSTIGITLVVLVLLPDATLQQAEQVRQDVHREADVLIHRKVLPKGKQATRDLQRLGTELFSGSSGNTQNSSQ